MLAFKTNFGPEPCGLLLFCRKLWRSAYFHYQTVHRAARYAGVTGSVGPYITAINDGALRAQLVKTRLHIRWHTTLRC